MQYMQKDCDASGIWVHAHTVDLGFFLIRYLIYYMSVTFS